MSCAVDDSCCGMPTAILPPRPATASRGSAHPGRGRHRDDLAHDVLLQRADVGLRRQAGVGHLRQAGDGVVGAVDQQLGPQLHRHVGHDAHRHLRAGEEVHQRLQRRPLGHGRLRAAAASRRWPGRRGRSGTPRPGRPAPPPRTPPRAPRGRAAWRASVSALSTPFCRLITSVAGAQVRRHLPRRGLGVAGLDAAQHQVGAGHGGRVAAGVQPHGVRPARPSRAAGHRAGSPAHAPAGRSASPHGRRAPASRRRSCPPRRRPSPPPCAAPAAACTRSFMAGPSDDLAGVAGPVLVAQQPLVELAGGVARQLGLEVDRARALDRPTGARGRRRSAPAPAPGRRRAMSRGCTTALTSSPNSSFGTPNTAHVDHLRVRDQHVLGLLRVDVHAAGDDHVAPCGRSGTGSRRRRRSRCRRASSSPAALRPAAVFSGSLWYSNGRPSAK